jgi:hypothetical protein
MSAHNKYRVIQWATGNVGSRALRQVIEHPDMELVGLWVSSEAKDGKDAGELCGLPATGIKATRSSADLIATEADCVVYMRQGIDFDEVCALLASGKNVVTTRGDFLHPRTMNADLRARIEAACATGNSSIYSTGSSPGFITEALVIPLLSLAREHSCLTIDEYADMTSRNSPEMIFNVMGFGVPMGDFDQGKVEFIKHEFAGSLGQIADAIGMPCDSFVARGELGAALHDKQIAAGLIPAGSVGAMRVTIEGLHQGKPILRFRANWYCTTDIAEDWNLRESGWKIVTEGDTPLEVNITYPVSKEQYPLFTPGLTAHRPVNAIPILCAAAPGIRTTVDMAQVIPKFAA